MYPLENSDIPGKLMVGRWTFPFWGHVSFQEGIDLYEYPPGNHTTYPLPAGTFDDLPLTTRFPWSLEVNLLWLWSHLIIRPQRIWTVRVILLGGVTLVYVLDIQIPTDFWCVGMFGVWFGRAQIPTFTTCLDVFGCLGDVKTSLFQATECQPNRCESVSGVRRSWHSWRSLWVTESRRG